MTQGYTMRFYQDESDYARMRDLLRETYTLSVPPLNCMLGDLDWWRATTNDPDVIRKVQLWFDSHDLLIAFVWPGQAQIDVMIRPEHQILEWDILQQAEAAYRQRLVPDATNRSFCFFSYTDDVLRNTMLMQRGYMRTDGYYPFHTLRLDHLPAPPTLPADYTIRHVSGEADLPARVAVHRAAFHPSRMTIEKHRQVMAAPTYRPELDLVAVAPDGTFAAYAIVWLDSFNRSGLFEPVGCHPDYQRRGLAGAVMREGMRRLYNLGATVAHVNAWREDSAGAALYRSLGFTVTNRTYGWEKQL